MTRALVPLTNGVDELEAVIVIDALRRAGVRTVTASVDATNPLIGQGRIRLMADLDIADALLEWGDAFDAIILPGGASATRTFAGHAALMGLCSRRHDAGAVVVGLGTSSRLAGNASSPVVLPAAEGTLPSAAYADAFIAPLIAMLFQATHSSR